MLGRKVISTENIGGTIIHSGAEIKPETKLLALNGKSTGTTKNRIYI